MKIYLLVLVLAVLAQSKFRHLRNLTITVPEPPLIKSLTATEIAYQYQDTIVMLNVSNNQELQRIKQVKPAPIQKLFSSPSNNILLYPVNNDIVQARSNARSASFDFKLKKSNWIPDFGAQGSTVVTAVYGVAGEDRFIRVFKPDPWKITTYTFAPITNQDTSGGSGVSMVNDEEYYFAAGGPCKDGDGKIYLIYGIQEELLNVYNFSVPGCNFGTKNQEWQLQTYQYNQATYALLTYAASNQFPKRLTSSLISMVGGARVPVAHFELERMFAVTVASQSVIYTADNLLCRVLEHDIQNHEHEHLQSPFKYTPKSIFVTPSEKYIVQVAPYDNPDIVRGLVYEIDENHQFKNLQIYGPNGNTIKAELLGDNFLFISSDFTDNPLTIFDRSDQDIINPKITGVADFCVSNKDILFLVLRDNGQTLTAYNMIGKTLTAVSDTIQLAFNIQAITCLDNNNILLNPDINSKVFYIYQFNDVSGKLEFKSQLNKDKDIHASVSYANDIIIFTSLDSTKSVFYDYGFKQLQLSFNLPVDSVYSIVQALKGQLLLAVGDDLTHFVSLEYYKNENSIIKYKGTFPYFDDGEADLSKTILFPDTKILHIEFSEGSTEWATYFDLDSPPLISIGYFYNADNQCSQFTDGVFHITPSSKQLIVLNSQQNSVTLEKYLITDKLTKVESYQLPYKNTAVTLKQSSNLNEIIISGINKNLNNGIQVRNINMLSKILFTKEDLPFSSGSLESVDDVDGMIVSSITKSNADDTKTLSLVVEANSNNPIAAQVDIFTAITTLVTCPNCSKIAYNGDLKTAITGTTIIVQEYQNPANYKSLTIDCKINFLALSPSGSQIAYSCINNTLFIENVATQVIQPLPQTYKSITELAFLNEKSLLANLDGKIIYIASVANKVLEHTQRSVGAVNSYAIDYNNGLYAVAVDPSKIVFYTLDGTLNDTFTLNNANQISSLTFNQNGDLLIATSNGAIITLSQTPCTIDQQLVQGYCQCKQLFAQNGDLCSCNYIYDKNVGSCFCDDGYFFNGGDSCESCSAMCSTCSSDGAFDCNDFSVWFYLIIIGGILIVAGGVLLAVFKLKKRKDKPESLYTEEKTKLSEPFVSERSQGPIGKAGRTSRDKIDE